MSADEDVITRLFRVKNVTRVSHCASKKSLHRTCCSTHWYFTNDNLKLIRNALAVDLTGNSDVTFYYSTFRAASDNMHLKTRHRSLKSRCYTLGCKNTAYLRPSDDDLSFYTTSCMCANSKAETFTSCWISAKQHVYCFVIVNSATFL